ncbi:hypothetical protein PHMEG_00039070 [Phytophthora megakarya]|uniref:Uncharacterized protein n=1 Tax=Phytophthora megakarya TaxID=4795 RepID=A0A225UG59_9STRA|nr:hypothetical protein PHMEG_00039070 [Phytophthora megakarya]
MSGRYSNTERIDYTKVLINLQPIKLPKLHTMGDYKAWRSEVPLHFETRMLGDITYGGERYDEEEGLRRFKYKEWFEARKNKAFSWILRTTFKIDEIRDSMDAATLLYSRITQHFEAADVTRKLQPNESVTAYVEDIARKVTQLHQTNGEFAEWQHASLLLSNCVEKFHDLAREHGDWINNHDCKTLSLAEALQRLCAAEHQRAQLRVQTRQTALQPMQVANINLGQGQGQRGHRKRSHGAPAPTVKVTCTAKTGIPLREGLVATLANKKRQQRKKPPVSLVNSVRRVTLTTGGDGNHGPCEGLELYSSPSVTDTIALTRETSSSQVPRLLTYNSCKQ